MSSIDSVVNMLCLTWSLKEGEEEYMRFCGIAHKYLVKLIDPSNLMENDGNRKLSIFTRKD